MQDHFLETAYRLREMKRFGIRQVNRDTSPAEHSWFTSVLALYISTHSDPKHEKYNLGELLAKAIMHDIPESITSDVPYFVKHHNRKTEDFFKFLEERICRDVLTDGMTDDIRVPLTNYILRCKDKTPEGKLVSLCDLVEPLWYLVEERTRGNNNIWVDEVVKQLQDMIYLVNLDLKEEIVTEIVQGLMVRFGPVKEIEWSDIMGGGYDKKAVKKARKQNKKPK
jgi:5'-deoxynucleotidase YfbR-like HD superfamily hydrolase